MAAMAVFMAAYYHTSPHYVFVDEKGYEGVATWCGVKNKELVCDK